MAAGFKRSRLVLGRLFYTLDAAGLLPIGRGTCHSVQGMHSREAARGAQPRGKWVSSQPGHP